MAFQLFLWLQAITSPPSPLLGVTAPAFPPPPTLEMEKSSFFHPGASSPHPHFAVGRDCLLHVSEPRALVHHHWEYKSAPLLWQNGHLSTIVVLLLSHV